GGSEIFYSFYPWIALLCHEICHMFDGRIPYFGHQHQTNGKHNCRPLIGRKSQDEAGDEHHHGGRHMYPCVMLHEKYLHTREGMCKAFDPIRKRKWLLFHSHLVCCWYPGGRLHLLRITALQAGTYMEVLIKITKKRPTANCWHRLRCRRTETMPKTSYFYKTLS